jgi:ssDNA-binding replication factor A large subunit
MQDFETLLGELLQQKPNVTKGEVLRRVEEKKKTVGAGYLTDQGALFLVAGEMGIALRRDGASSDMKIGDLYIGANDVTVVARVLAIYPESSYNRKDGGTGRYRRLALFDGQNVVRLTVWEEGLEQLNRLGLNVDSPVRVANAYVKQGLDGKPNLNLGRRGRIELLTDEKAIANLPPIATLVQKLPALQKDEQFIAVEGIVSTEPRYSEFVRSDGSEGSLFQFGLSGDGGKETRVVIWSPSSQPKLGRGQRVRITNVKSKRSNSGDYELHGDAGSTVVTGELAALKFRVAATSSSTTAKLVLGIGSDKKVRLIEVGKGVEEPKKGQLIDVFPDQIGEGRVYCRNPGSIQVVEDGGFPGLEQLATKLEEANEEDVQIMVDVIALSNGNVEDVKLKDGTNVKKGELVIGDDTGDLTLVAWRDVASRLSGIVPGQRLRLVGVSPKPTKMGGRTLQLSSFSVVERLGGRA